MYSQPFSGIPAAFRNRLRLAAACWLAIQYGYCNVPSVFGQTTPSQSHSAQRDPMESGNQRPPNLVILLADNLGYGDIEPFGSKLHRTPALNRMSREGCRFTSFYVTSGVCTPSRASLMTGCYAQRVGMHWNPRDGQVLRPLSPYGLHPRETTLAEVARQRGYATGLIGKWHLGDQLDFLPTRQGFQEFLGIPYSDDMTADVGQRLGDRFDGHTWPPLPLMQNEQVVEAPVDRNGLTQRYTLAAQDFIRRHAKRPFLLVLSHAMPGSTARPFASERFRGKSRNGAWGDAIEELDWSTGEILDTLRELGIHENTWVVWTSDNGAPLAGDVQAPTRGSNQPWHGRGYTTAEGAFRVPTLMWWPGTIPAGTRCPELCSTMDLLPTLAALIQAELPARKLDGHDIQPLLRQPESAQSPYDAFYYYQMRQLQAVRQGRWKLFVPLKEFSRHPHFTPQSSAQPLLFDVSQPQGSTTNRAAEHPEVVQRLMDLVDPMRLELGDSETAGSGQRLRGHVQQVTPRRMN